MKKTLLLVMFTLIVFIIVGCVEETDPDDQQTYLNYNPIETDGLILEEQYRSFMFFWETSNRDPNSPGYGMSRDRFPNASGVASIASVGFALAGLPIGVNNEWITYEEGFEHASLTMDTLLEMEHHEGFFFHFISMDTTERVWDSEVSIIDTALLIVGALVAGQFFGEEVHEKAMTLYERIDWNWYLNDQTNEFYMSYLPEDGYHTGAWVGFAEQLMMYVLGAGSKTHNTSAAPYNVMKFKMINQNAPYISEVDSSRNVDSYYFAPSGELFIHQYSHAFIAFNEVLDPDGLDWYENARRATLAQYNFALDYQTKYRTVSATSWGVSASDGPNGYHAYGTPPYFRDRLNFDGTVAPYASMASIIFMAEEVTNTAYYFKTLSNLWGPYGFKAAFNLGTHTGYSDARIDGKEPYYSPDVIGIDKGITMLMIENYRSGLIWDIFMDIEVIQDGLDVLGFTEK